MIETKDTKEQITDLVSGHGVSNPDAIFIIDHPQGEDYKSGYALTGSSEHTVRSLLKDNGLYLDQYYRTSLIKTLDPLKIQSLSQFAGKGGTKKYVEHNLVQAKVDLPILINEINTLNPNLLVPLSELSFTLLTGVEGIRKFRGSILQTSLMLNETLGLKKQIKVLPALGPYPYLNQDYKMRMITRLDFSRIAKYSNDSLPPEQLIRVWVCKTAGEFRAFIERNYKDDGLLTFDIETYLQIPTCISFCFNGQESCCVPLLDRSIDRDNLALLWMLVGKLLRSKIRKGNQNIKYDWKILNRWGFEVTNVQEDSNLAAGTIYCEFPKNLGFLTSIYTELPYFKDEGKEFDPTVHRREQLYLYNAKDSLAAWQIIKKQNEDALELGVFQVYRKLVALIPIYKRAEERGIRIDEARSAALLAKYSTLYNIETLKLRSLANNDRLNPLSSVQMGKLVFEELGYDTGKYVQGTDEESLEWLIQSATHRSFVSRDILKCIINARKIHKVIEILQLPIHPDKRFRGEFNLVGTETGRSSGGKTTDQLLIVPEKGKIKVKNLGHSLQTIGKHGFSIDGTTYGKDIRDIFVPNRGYSFVEGDLSGAEARVDRVISGNYDMEVFNNPGIHKLTGSWLYDCEPSQVQKNKLIEVAPGLWVDRYHVSKIVRHAAERNVGPDSLVNIVSLTRTLCVDLLKKIHDKQPEIRRVYHKSIIDALNETHTLIMPNGRRRDFFERIGYQAYNEGFSLYPQAIVSDQTKFEGVLKTFSPDFSNVDWAEFLIEQHDGVLAEVPIGREEEYCAIYKKNVEIPIDFRNGSLKHDYELVIPAEFEKGESSWSSMKSLEI